MALVFYWPSTSSFYCTDDSAPIYIGKLQETEPGLELGVGINLESKATEKWIPADKGQSNENLCDVFGQGKGPCPYQQVWAHADAGNSLASLTPSVTSSLSSARKCDFTFINGSSPEIAADTSANAAGSLSDFSGIFVVVMFTLMHAVTSRADMATC